jgi:hypothetical protein
MTTPGNTEKPNEEVQELTDDNLEEVSGGIEYDNALGNPKSVLDNPRTLTAEAQITPPA